MKQSPIYIIVTVIFTVLFASCVQKSGVMGMKNIQETDIQSAIDALVEQHGDMQLDRIETGVRQAARFWTKSDGSEKEFIEFCKQNFIADPDILGQTVGRFEKNTESVSGNLIEIVRDLREPMDLDIGPMIPVDYAFAEYSPFAHVNEDMFKTKIAFHALLNFKRYTLKERLELGPEWSRQDWAKARLAEQFSARVPSEVGQEINKAYVLADDYIGNYNIYMHHVLDENGNRLFPPGLRLLAHWNLRDELKAQYDRPEGLPRQELIYSVMQRIIDQTIPEMAINNPTVDWHITDNTLSVSDVDTENREAPDEVKADREPDTRYQRLLDVFHAEKLADPYYPETPTKIDRRFQVDREIPEEEVIALFESLLTSEAFNRTGQLIAKRLGRHLKPFDIWYSGFRAKSVYSEPELDRIVSKKYPTPAAFQADIQRILLDLRFARKTAKFLASKIIVDPARGSGHAWGAEHREDNAHLRTRVSGNGMNYKGYNIACHELGHNCEQVISLNLVDNTLLSGVPNTAFTEAFAFVFQARDLDLLGLKQKNPMQSNLNALKTLWSTCEIAGVALVDIRVWHWMYDNPDASPAELKAAVIQISKDVWNQYFAPVFGIEDASILAIYSHMINSGLYLPDYPIGQIIAFQIEQYLKGKSLGVEMERMCRLGSITPGAWMQAAVHAPISTEPILKASDRALAVLENQ